ncbi:hypothetical protein HU200_013333 [Digitaria exilis]|uniref:Legume lectin domain-containing protein n=1 Tax=Digitaria exilis TaxID=1010633 RepID=A0A835FDW2_9POAL|nr:hypothetical protein HU200_013333 [Digitaria exilis]
MQQALKHPFLFLFLFLFLYPEREHPLRPVNNRLSPFIVELGFGSEVEHLGTPPPSPQLPSNSPTSVPPPLTGLILHLPFLPPPEHLGRVTPTRAASLRLVRLHCCRWSSSTPLPLAERVVHDSAPTRAAPSLPVKRAFHPPPPASTRSAHAMLCRRQHHEVEETAAAGPSAVASPLPNAVALPSAPLRLAPSRVVALSRDGPSVVARPWAMLLLLLASRFHFLLLHRLQAQLNSGTFTNMCRSAGMAHLLLLTCLAYLNAEAPPPSSSRMACFTVALGNSSAASPGCLSKMGQEPGGGHGAAPSVCLSKSGQEGGGGDDGADWSSDEAERRQTCLKQPSGCAPCFVSSSSSTTSTLQPSLSPAAAAIDEFLYSGFAAGSSNLSLDCVTTLTNFTEMQKGNAFHPTPLCLRGSIVGIVPVTPCMGGHSLKLVVYLLRLDTVLMSPEFHDLDNNHVGVDVNTLDSTAAASAGYYDDSHIVGKTDAPACKIDEKQANGKLVKVPNPAYEDLFAQDHQVVGLIFSSVGKDVFLQITNMFTAQFHARTMDIRLTMTTTKKGGWRIWSWSWQPVTVQRHPVQLHRLQAAMPIAAAAAYSVDINWYTDMGATDHVTSELEKLSVRDSTRKVTTSAWQAVQPPAAALTSSLPDHVRLSPVATTSSIGVRGSMMAGHLQRRLDFLWLHRHTLYQL